MFKTLFLPFLLATGALSTPTNKNCNTTTPYTNSTNTTTTASNHKIIYYHDRANDTNGKHVSLLPLIRNGSLNDDGTPQVTNILIATFDLNSTGLFLRSPDEHHEYPLSSPKFDQLWSDVKKVQKAGIKVSAMVLGNWRTLAGNQSHFETGYAFLRDGLKNQGFDGIDIDVEDATAITLEEIIRLVDALRKDFGKDFLITFSPVAEALSGGRNLSGFNYKALEQKRGSDIDWYNGQFYNSFGWGGTPKDYEAIVEFGFPAKKVVMGLSTDPANADDFVPFPQLKATLGNLTAKYKAFAGVAGWVYFDARPGRQDAPEKWSQQMAKYMS